MSLSTLSSGLRTLISFSYKVCWQNKSCNDDSAFLSDGNGYRRNASNTCAVASISSISGVTSTNVQSFGVRADSIHVTRVISFTLVNIWETIYIFALYQVCHFKMGLSRVITLIIVNNKTYFVIFFCFLYKLDIWSVYFMTNITIYQPDRCETAGLFLLRHPPPPKKKKKIPRGVSCHKTAYQILM